MNFLPLKLQKTILNLIIGVLSIFIIYNVSNKFFIKKNSLFQKINIGQNIICSDTEPSHYILEFESEFLTTSYHSTSFREEVLKEIISHIKYSISSIELSLKNSVLEMDFSNINLKYWFTDSPKDISSVTFGSNQHTSPFYLNFHRILFNHKNPKQIHYQASLKAIGCGKIPKFMTFNLPKKAFVDQNFQENPPRNCLRSEYSKKYMPELRWFFWYGNDDVCSLSEDLIKLSIQTKKTSNRISKQKSQLLFNKSTRNILSIIINPEFSTDFDFNKKYFLQQDLINKVLALKEFENAKLFVSSLQPMDDTAKTYLILLWSLFKIGFKIHSDILFQDHFIKVNLKSAQEASEVHLYFIRPDINNNIYSKSDLHLNLNRSDLIIYTGHSQVGNGNINLILEALNSQDEMDTKIIAVFSCHSYMYYKHHAEESKHNYILNTGEIFDYEGRLAFGLISDYLGFSEEMFYDAMKRQTKKSMLYILNQNYL